jgi:hypothetical protein
MRVWAVRPAAVSQGFLGRRAKSGLARTRVKPCSRKAARAKNPRGGAAQARRHVKCNREQTSRWPVETHHGASLHGTGDG